MKIHRYKRVRRILSFYRINFGLQPPYRVLVDGTFCKAALENKINLREQMPIYLGAPVELCTSSCVVKEMEILGRPLAGAVHIAKQFRLVKCTHDSTPQRDPDDAASDEVDEDEPVSAFRCILNVIRASRSDGNARRWIVGTLDDNLTERLRKFPGVPILFIRFNAVLLERPPPRSIRAASGAIQSRLDTSVLQNDTASAVKRNVDGDVDVAHPPKKKRKGPKGPNPLSCKKKTKTASEASTGSTERTRKRRNRTRNRHRSKKKFVEIVNSVQ